MKLIFVGNHQDSSQVLIMTDVSIKSKSSYIIKTSWGFCCDKVVHTCLDQTAGSNHCHSKLTHQLSQSNILCRQLNIEKILSFVIIDFIVSQQCKIFQYQGRGRKKSRKIIYSLIYSLCSAIHYKRELSIWKSYFSRL